MNICFRSICIFEEMVYTWTAPPPGISPDPSINLGLPYFIVMALSLVASSGLIFTTGSTMVGRSALRLTHPYSTCKPSMFISSCDSHKLPNESSVRILDTTLRDGEQSAGGALTPLQKLEIARQLAKLRVDIIEVGFPMSSQEEFDNVETIAKTVGNEVDEETGYVPVICAIARSKQSDIEAAWDSVKYAKKPRVNIFISASDIHLKYKFKKTREEIIEMATTSIRYAKSLGFKDIQFGCEDAGRADKDFLCKLIEEGIKAGATSVGVGDTVGINMPQEFGEIVSYVKANTPGIDDAVLFVHCHNDLGLATANTLAGICAGARQVDVTINGIGDRSGNAALEEVVMALKYRGSYLLDGVFTRVETHQIMATSKMVQEHSGLYVQPHKPIVGENCFVHESGIHQDGVLKNRSTYEIISPEDVGVVRSLNSGILLGKLSGRHAVKGRLRELGYEIDNDKLNDIFSRFRDLTKQKKKITDDDMKALVTCGDETSS